MIRRALVVLCVVTASLFMLVAPAPAQAPDAQGWWWIGGSPLGTAPPYVPADGLYVASNPTGPEAVSALRFRLAGAGGAGTLTLEVAGDVRGTPVVGLCTLATPWEPTRGGPLSAAPDCDPNGATAPGTFSGDGRTVTFPVGALVREDSLDVGVVPGVADGGRAPTFQLALAKPGAGALAAADTSDAGAGPEEPAPSDPAPSPAPVDETSFTPAPIAPTPFDAVAPVTAFESVAADLPLAVGIPPSVPPASAGGGGLQAVPLSGGAAGRDRDPVDSGPWRVVGFVVLAGTALVYHRLSTTMDRPPRSLVAFGHVFEDPA